MSITVVGSVAYDDLQTPFGKVERTLGGAGTHFSVSASFFTKIKLIGVVGGDFESKHIEFLTSRGIDLEGLQIVKDGKTFHWKGKYELDMNTAHTLETHLNVFEGFNPKVPESYRNPDILCLANIDPDLQLKVIAEAGQPKKFTALDTMNLWISIKKPSLIEVIRRVDLVTINESEARQLTETPNLIKAAKLIQSWGPKTVVIKRGEYGALLFHDKSVFSAPGLPLESVFDPTGAGDSFAGGMLGYLDRVQKIDFETLKTAVIAGSVMASFNVEKFSCDRLREISMKDIQTRFAEFESLGSFEGMYL